ncbi:MAG: hypothetical protein HY236_09990 [Acidobacteria bacterium]|nr:hypothetical protein [Acidobacteriota bacterium]
MTDRRAELKQARKTALAVGSVLLVLAGGSLWRGHLLRAEIFGGAGAVLLLLGLAAPRWTVPFHRAWMKLAGWLGYVNSRVLLSIMYYGVLTPVGFLLRLAGRDPLRRRKGAASCWIPRPRTRQDREQFERLF